MLPLPLAILRVDFIALTLFPPMHTHPDAPPLVAALWLRRTYYLTNFIINFQWRQSRAWE